MHDKNCLNKIFDIILQNCLGYLFLAFVIYIEWN